MQELLQAHPDMQIGELSAALDCSRSGYHAPRRKARRQPSGAALRLLEIAREHPEMLAVA